MRPHHYDIAGQRFGRLLAVSRVTAPGKSRWACECECGKRCEVDGYRLTSGQTKSCGCKRVDIAKRLNLQHGGTHTKEHKTWLGMLQRCHGDRSSGFHKYGAKGIAVCERWRDKFETFLHDMGPAPFARATIERNDNAKGYEPGNCRWATFKEQVRNRSNTKLYQYRGQEVTIVEALEMVGSTLPYRLAWARLNHLGWTFAKTVETPKLANRWAPH